MSEDLARAIEDKRFTPVRLREGYDMGEVDEFLDRLVAALARGQDLAPLVEGALFSPVRLREGYDMGEVDRFLDEVVTAQQSTGHSSGRDRADEQGMAPTGPTASTRTPRAAPPRADSPPAAHPSVIEEKPGLWSRITGRNR